MADDSLLARLTEEFIKNIRSGKQVEVEEYARRYPEQAERIRELFPTLMLLERMAQASSPKGKRQLNQTMLPPDSMLNHYCVGQEIGRGGMGIVYQATDRKLGREVAIKVLPEEFSSDADRMARFQREANLLATLNHPNIAAIYGREESDGTNFLVMELVEGDTLANRISRGAIPVEEALKLALQIAEALEAAHEKGVVHRDLKPANIKTTPDEKVKVLDFGLAKAYAGNTGDVNVSNVPTLGEGTTMPGVILGTAAYMSPEQACGKPVDRKADIWAFGVVLFEMLTGRPLFAGEDISSTLVRVLEREPDFSALPPNLHPRIRQLTERCLKKDPRNRYHDIADARVDIQEVLADPSGVFVQPVSAAETRSRRRLILVTAATVLVLGGILFGVAAWYLKPHEPPQVQRFDYDLPEDQVLDHGHPHLLAISADGTKLVYIANGRMFLKKSDELEGVPIYGTEEDPVSPCFSPDGEWIAYYSEKDKKLKKIPVDGGIPTVLCEKVGPAVMGMTWYADDTIVYYVFPHGPMRISAYGGEPKPLVEPGVGSIQTNSQMLPYGKIWINKLNHVRLPESEAGKLLGQGIRVVEYLPTGHIIYFSNNALYAAPFDRDNLEVEGAPVPILTGILGGFVVSDSGTLVYIPGRVQAIPPSLDKSLVLVDRKGNEIPSALEPDYYNYCRFSPDGMQIACRTYSMVTDKHIIVVGNTAGGDIMQLTFNDDVAFPPLWTPNGERIVFSSSRDGGGIYRRNADGTGAAELLLASNAGEILSPCSWSKDGKYLVFQSRKPSSGQGDIEILSMEENRERKPLLQERYHEAQARISPDGKWIAYTSWKSGIQEIFVHPFPNVDDGTWKVSKDSGWDPKWSPKGRELFYTSPDGLMSVAVETEPVFNPRTTLVLFKKDIFNYDVHPDGERFLVIKQSKNEDAESRPAEYSVELPRKLIFVTNWFEELKQKVPVP